MKTFTGVTILTALVLLAAVAATHHNEHYAPAYYGYGYAVRDPYNYADYGHTESRLGDNTKGQYTVLLPDGRRQIVTYYVDGDSGFVADVKYIGQPTYDHYVAPHSNKHY